MESNVNFYKSRILSKIWSRPGRDQQAYTVIQDNWDKSKSKYLFSKSFIFLNDIFTINVVESCELTAKVSVNLINIYFVKKAPP